jgi:hypothetical protein
MLKEEIKQLYRHYSELMNGKPTDFPIGTVPDDFGGRHLEISSDGKLALVATERGRETERQETYSIDDLLYWVFCDQANSKAFYRRQEKYDYAASQKIALAELGKISLKWQERLRLEQQSYKRS